MNGECRCENCKRTFVYRNEDVVFEQDENRYWFSIKCNYCHKDTQIEEGPLENLFDDQILGTD